MRREPRIKSKDLLPKIEPLPGSVCAQMKRCGRSNCKCSKGELHGPYFYHFWREGRKLRKKYVKKADFERVFKGCEARKENKREVRRLISEMKGRCYGMEKALRVIFRGKYVDL